VYCQAWQTTHGCAVQCTARCCMAWQTRQSDARPGEAKHGVAFYF
jgi:hypothetical protein